MSWVYLFVAIALEVMGTTCMKLSDGFRRPVPSILIFVFYGLCFAVLPLAVQRLGISTVYAIWSGVGTATIAFIGIVWFAEPATVLKWCSIAVIIFGVMGLHLSDMAVR